MKNNQSVMFLLHRTQGCVIASVMSATFHGFPFCAVMCLMLAACTPPAKKANVLDLYELPHTGTRATPVDNDSYYSQPGGYKGCAEINDAPSCGGG